MRVLQLIDSLQPGGAERVALSYANALAQAQHASFLCATRKEGALKEQLNPGVGYLFLKKRSTLDIAAVRRLVKFCKENKVEIIHAHSTSFFTATLARVLLRDVKLVWHDHFGKSDVIIERPGFVLKWCSKYFDAILAVNQALEAWAKEELKAKEVIYFKNAVPILNASLVEARKLPGQNGQRILLMANFREVKDHHNALKAIKILKETEPEVSLHLLGMHWDDHYYKSVLLSIEELNLKDTVHLHGSQQDVSGFIKACDIGLLSSHTEGLPMAVLEYAALGLPVVCTRVGQCERVVKDDGYLAAPNDPEELAQCLTAALADTAEATKRAERLLKRVKAEYSIQTIIPKLLAVYASSH